MKSLSAERNPTVAVRVRSHNEWEASEAFAKPVQHDSGTQEECNVATGKL